MKPNKSDYLFELAFRAHTIGRTPEAIKIYQTILGLDPGHPNALHYLGVAYLQQGNPEKAIRTIQQSLTNNPNSSSALSDLAHCLNLIGDYEGAAKASADATLVDSKNHGAWTNLGNAQKALGESHDALESYRIAVELQPDNPSYIYNLANALFAKAEFAKAKFYFQKCISIESNFPQAYNNLAACHIQLDEPFDAIENAQLAIKLNPGFAEAWNNLGAALRETHTFDEALASYDKALAINPGYAEAWNNRGIILKDLQRINESLECFDHAIRLQPGYAQAWNHHGAVLCDLSRFDEAYVSLSHAIELKSDIAEFWCNHGNALGGLGQLEQAVVSYSKAAELSPNYPEAWCNLGIALSELQRIDEAIASFDRAICLRPDYADACFAKGNLLLSQRIFDAGFRLYASRWKSTGFNTKILHSAIPEWHGSEGSKGRLLVWAEQGLGDEIFYASAISELSRRQLQITVAVDPRLVTMFRRSFPWLSVVDKSTLDAYVETHPMDWQVPLGELYKLCSLDESKIKSLPRPYLKPNADINSKIRLENDFFGAKWVCGVSWKSQNKSFGIEKSVHLDDLGEIFLMAGVEFVNLQYGDVSEDIQYLEKKFNIKIRQAKNLDLFNNIEGLLSLVDCCDFVITSSNINAHLAGAIGKKGAVIVPSGRGKFWYWHSDSGVSLWYPSLKIFDQGTIGDWRFPVDQAVSWIKEVL